MPGDILFYESGAAGDMGDKLIEAWTGSKIVHVAIAISAYFKVEALLNGVVKTPINYVNVYCSYLYHDSAKPNNNLPEALVWLEQQVGQMYGYGDIVNAFLDKFESGISINVGDHLDCSGLASDFLIRAGGTPASQIKDIHNVTPIQLAEVLGVNK